MGNPANKAEAIDNVASKLDISKAAAAKAVDAVLDFISDSLKNDRSVAFIGFGTFLVNTRAARKGRNPRTGEEIQIKEAKIPQFKAGKALKDAVNSASGE